MKFSVKKIDHIGIAVEDLDNALKFYQHALSLTFTGIEEIPDQKVRTVFIQLGDLNIELLVPTDEESTIHKFLIKRGSGIHHIALEVDDIETALEELEAGGIQLIDKKPRIGAHNKKIAFIHPGSTQGVLLELCESSDDNRS